MVQAKHYAGVHGLMGRLNEVPQTIEEFGELSWPEKRQLKETSPDVYWSFIWQIREIEIRKEDCL